VQPLLIGQHLNVADRRRAVGDRHRHIDQHPARIVTSPALPQPPGRLRQRRGQPGPVGELGQQHRPGMRHHALAVGSDRRGSYSLYGALAKCLPRMVIMFPQQEHNPMPGRHFRSFTALSADKDQISTATSGPDVGATCHDDQISVA
jgi:hypothetical protein